MKNLYLILCFFISLPILAQEKDNTAPFNIITDRPDQTESAVVVPLNYFQVESGTYIQVSENAHNWALINNLFRYGVAKNLELRMISELSRVSFANSTNHQMLVSDLKLGLKYGLINKEVQLAFLGHVTLPSGTYNYSEEVSINALMCFSHGLTDRSSVAYNIGVNYTNADNYELLCTISTGFSLTNKLGFFAEIYANAPLFKDFFFNYDSGFTYLLKPNLQLDFSFGTGITEKSNFYSAGVSWRIPN